MTKKMFLHAAVIFTLLTGGTALYAQMGPEQGGGNWGRGQGQPPTAEQRLQRMTQQLNLTGANSRNRMIPITTPRRIAIDENRSPVLETGNNAKSW